MSKLSKALLIILTICVALALALGITYSVKRKEKEVDNTASAYEQLLEDLQKELNVSVQNVTELEVELELKGLTIDDLTKTVTKYQTEVKTLKDTVTFYETQIVERDKIVKEKETEIKEVEKKVTEYKEQIVELESEGEDNQEEINRLKAQIVELESQIAEKNRTINELREELARMTDTKTQIETQVVEKDRVITQKEQELQEKENENAQLVININVLNETIINLNVRIELLEEAINRRDDANYLDDFMGSSMFTCRLDDYFALVSSNSAYYKDIYLVNLIDFSYESIYTNDSYQKERVFDNYVKMQNGDILIYTSSKNGILYFDSVTKTIVDEEDFFRPRVYGTLTNGDLLFYSTGGWGLVHANQETKTLTEAGRGENGREFSSNSIYLGSDSNNNAYAFNDRNDEYGGIWFYDYNQKIAYQVGDLDMSFLHDLHETYFYFGIYDEEHNIAFAFCSQEVVRLDLNNYTAKIYSFRDLMTDKNCSFAYYREVTKEGNYYKFTCGNIAVKDTENNYYGGPQYFSFYYSITQDEFMLDMPEATQITKYGVVRYFHDTVTTGYYTGYDDYAFYDFDLSAVRVGDDVILNYYVTDYSYKFVSLCYVTRDEHGTTQYNRISLRDGNKFTITQDMFYEGHLSLALVIQNNQY